MDEEDTLPFDKDDPVWDKFYGTPAQKAAIAAADRAIRNYVNAHIDIVMELDSAPGCWHCRAWTTETFDGFHMILVSPSETQSDTPMEAVQKAIALLEKPIGDPPIIDDIPPEDCSIECEDCDGLIWVEDETYDGKEGDGDGHTHFEGHYAPCGYRRKELEQ